MNMRKGLTLIELLIVVTIIAILAGAAVPFVQDYVEQARFSRARKDLDEIRNALVRWEVERGPWAAADVSVARLVGPYLSKALIDPWGSPYRIMESNSLVYSFGPDRINNFTLGDDFELDFRPPMAVVRVEYIDTDNTGTFTTEDIIRFHCTRPIALTPAAALAPDASIQLASGGVFVGLNTISTSPGTVVGRTISFLVLGGPVVGAAISGIVNVGTPAAAFLRDTSSPAAIRVRQDIGALRLQGMN